MSTVTRPTLTQVFSTFVPFGLLFTAALFAAEPSLELTRSRVIYTAWASLVLAIPALCLFILPQASAARATTARLLWTFSFIVYLAHFCYAVFGIYHGSLRELYAGQGPGIATANLAVTVLWAYDVAEGWLADAVGWRGVLRTVTRVAVALIFFVSSVVIFGGFARILGLIMSVAIVVCLFVRGRFRRRLGAAAVAAPKGLGLSGARLP